MPNNNDKNAKFVQKEKKRTTIMKKLTILLVAVCIVASCLAQEFTIRRGTTLGVWMKQTDRPVAETALRMVKNDAQRTFGCNFVRTKTKRKASIRIDIDTDIPREGFRLTVRKGILTIEGADTHGMAYGLMELSRLMGVSPWEDWADCTPRLQDQIRIADGYTKQEAPMVDYRGIFINDEDWGLLPWATRQQPDSWSIRQGRIKGAVGPWVTERIFQLMLRLRANYYWPPMHECSQPFFTIDGNREIASQYGIYIGGSHCEPMATSPAAEWALTGEGEYNYVTNGDAVRRFWQKRLNEVKNQEIVYTIGMRGVHDGAMQGVRTKQEKLEWLQRVIDDQREMINQTMGKDREVPQVFVPYKEVLETYHSGLRVPDDVTLMWTDDNYGYIRHFPDSAEKARKGGNGVYYHASYWGRPHDYLWLNSLSPKLMEQQMRMAYEEGIRRMWILNVGDIKPSELQIDQFMQLAWNGTTESFAKREFGTTLGAEIDDIMEEYFALSAEMKPEHMGGTRVEEADKAYWGQIRPLLGDWTTQRIARRVARYEAISNRTEELWRRVPDERRDAFYELVKYPVQAAAQMNFKFLCPERCIAAYDSIQALTHIYNKVCAGGKWDGIMDAQPRQLPVFARIEPQQLPEYPESSPWVELKRSGDWTYILPVSADNDSAELCIHLVPNHPVEGSKIAFAVCVDGVTTDAIEYQTYDRSEEWKQNVIRGYAVRRVKVAISARTTNHTVTIVPRTKGVEVVGVYALI